MYVAESPNSASLPVCMRACRVCVCVACRVCVCVRMCACVRGHAYVGGCVRGRAWRVVGVAGVAWRGVHGCVYD